MKVLSTDSYIWMKLLVYLRTCICCSVFPAISLWDSKKKLPSVENWCCTDHISVDLGFVSSLWSWFSIPGLHSSWPSHIQWTKVKGQAVQKLEWRQTNKHDKFVTYSADVVSKKPTVVWHDGQWYTVSCGCCSIILVTVKYCKQRLMMLSLLTFCCVRKSSEVAASWASVRFMGLQVMKGIREPLFWGPLMQVNAMTVKSSSIIKLDVPSQLKLAAIPGI